MLSADSILAGLNEQQIIAVQNYIGPQFIIAGPGSGKTMTIVKRTQYMIANDIKPWNILLFTFTNKAAKEIKNRVVKVIGDIANSITVGTYHSFCYKLLCRYVEYTGYKPGFSIIDSDDAKSIIKKICGDYEEKLVTAYIEKQKRKLITVQQAIERGDKLAPIYQEYQETLYARNIMDFNDLIFNTIKVLELNPDILTEVNNHYKYICADEFHDSSEADIRLVELLSGQEQNVCMILDDDQSIYGFRGANLEAVLDVEDYFNNLKMYFLSNNYRCSGNIVRASRSLIAHNSNQIEGKVVSTTNPPGSKVIYFQEALPDYESIRICAMIKQLKKKYGYKNDDIAILYRTSAQSRSVEEMLLKNNISYEVLSGINFYNRREIKDIISFLLFINNPYNYTAFTRIINIPRRGVGNTTLEKISGKILELKDQEYNILQVLQIMLDNNEIKGRAKAGIIDFISKINELSNLIGQISVDELVRRVISDFNYLDFLEKEEEKMIEEKRENVGELINISYDFATLDEFLETAALDRLNTEDKNTDKVHLLTMHMSKGLEWKVVFCIGISEGTLPHFRSLGTTAEIEEERRLLYVAMTRAKEILILSRSKKIRQNGYYVPCKESRYIREINKQYLYEYNQSNRTS